MPPRTSIHTTNCERIQILTLLATGIIKQTEIAEIFGISTQTIHKLVTKTKNRGYDPSDYRTLRLEHVIDKEGRGAKPKVKAESEQQIVECVTNDNSFDP